MQLVSDLPGQFVVLEREQTAPGKPVPYACFVIPLPPAWAIRVTRTARGQQTLPGRRRR